MSKTIPTGEITGKVNANPNPIPFGQGNVEISWETNDPAGAELRVCLSSGEERLVRRGHSGTVEIPWIKHSAEYYLRVYGASQPDVPLDTVRCNASPQGTFSAN